jgi:hypothetical protein
MASAGYTWYKWAKTHVPDRMRGIGTRQLYMIRHIRILGGEYVPITKGDREICESLHRRGCVVRRFRGQDKYRYSLTVEGVSTYILLRGDEYYEKRGL